MTSQTQKPKMMVVFITTNGVVEAYSPDEIRAMGRDAWFRLADAHQADGRRPIVMRAAA